MFHDQPGVGTVLQEARAKAPVSLASLPVAWAMMGGSKEINVPTSLPLPYCPAYPVVLRSEWAVPAYPASLAEHTDLSPSTHRLWKALGSSLFASPAHTLMASPGLGLQRLNRPPSTQSWIVQQAFQR